MERYKLLFSKYINNTCTKDELNEFIDWIKDPENDQYLKNLITKDWGSFDFGPGPQAKEHEKFLGLLNQIEKEQTNDKEFTIYNDGKLKMKGPVINALLKIAAGVLLPVALGLGTYGLVNRFNNTRSHQVFNTVTAPNGSKTKIILSDSTRIWLNSGSTITYPALFTDKQREVHLTGEGYFEVAKDPAKPFIVKTSDIDIKVLGTKFNLKSYPEEGTIETTLLEGSVAICKGNEEINNKKNVVLLKPNERATFIKKEGRIVQTNLDDKTQPDKQAAKPAPERKEQLILSKFTDAEEFTSWKDEKLIFRNENFEEICIKMERWYNVKININNGKLKNYHYTGTLQNENIVEAIKAFQLTIPLRYEINHDIIDIWLQYK